MSLLPQDTGPHHLAGLCKTPCSSTQMAVVNSGHIRLLLLVPLILEASTSMCWGALEVEDMCICKMTSGARCGGRLSVAPRAEAG